MDLISITNQIQKKISEIDNIRKDIKERGELRAQTAMEYDKLITITLIKLKNGTKFEIDGEIIDSPPATIMEKIAKGICWQEKLEMEKADANYKSLITNLEAVKAQLNGLQSIHRNLD